MPRLLAQVAEQLTLDANVRVLLQRLSAPAVRCAKLEPGLLTSLQHPLWRLVDRIAALGESRGGTQAARLAAHLEPVLVKLEHGADATSAAYKRAWPTSTRWPRAGPIRNWPMPACQTLMLSLE